MFFRKCSHSAANFSNIFPRVAPQQSELESHTTVVINFFRASNCLHETFSSFCAVFLGSYNVSISCHLVNWKRRLSTAAKCNLLFWVFIVFGSWQVTRNATKSKTVALKRTNLAVIESWNFSSSFQGFVLFLLIRLDRSVELSKSATRLLQQINPISSLSFHRLLQFTTAIDIFPEREEVGFLLIFHRLSGGSVRCRFCFSFKKLLHNLFTLLTLSNPLRINFHQM